jgi:hypothetical protein
MKTYGVLYEKRENDSGGIVRELHNGSLDYWGCWGWNFFVVVWLLWWYRVFKLEFHLCQVRALQLEPHPQPLCLYFSFGVASYYLCLGWPQNHELPASTSKSRGCKSRCGPSYLAQGYNAGPRKQSSTGPEYGDIPNRRIFSGLEN